MITLEHFIKWYLIAVAHRIFLYIEDIFMMLKIRLIGSFKIVRC